jgi:hypothetical protein
LHDVSSSRCGKVIGGIRKNADSQRCACAARKLCFRQMKVDTAGAIVLSFVA